MDSMHVGVCQALTLPTEKHLATMSALQHLTQFYRLIESAAPDMTVSALCLQQSKSSRPFSPGCVHTPDTAFLLLQRLLNATTGENMDAICLKAAADNVYRLTKRIAGRMGFDKDSGRIETAASKKDKEKQFRGLSRNFGKVSHCNPVIVAEYLVAYVRSLLPSLFVHFQPYHWTFDTLAIGWATM